jgi:hypothetical protein
VLEAMTGFEAQRPSGWQDCGEEDGQLMAGSSQDRVQVGCRKPVIHDDPAREILAGSSTAGDGRTDTSSPHLRGRAASRVRRSRPDQRRPPTMDARRMPLRSFFLEALDRVKMIPPLLLGREPHASHAILGVKRSTFGSPTVAPKRRLSFDYGAERHQWTGDCTCSA